VWLTWIFAGISVEAVPMYNLPRPEGGELRHPPGRGNGYVRRSHRRRRDREDAAVFPWRAELTIGALL
jgi:hypothetical protein